MYCLYYDDLFVNLCFCQSDDRQVASDGFMLNLMAVLQQLCVKVKMDKVDYLLFYVKNKIRDRERQKGRQFGSQEGG